MNDLKNVKVGQMCEYCYELEECIAWQYVVAINVFDDRIHFLKDDGGHYMHVFEVQDDSERDFLDRKESKTHLIMLYKDGKPVFSKKTLFGKYTFEPKQ